MELNGGMTHCVHRINSLSTFIPFAFNPVAIEISEQSVDVVRSRRVSVPLASVIS